ncbi:hypothetical protein [Escherichia coli]|uniref:hypothetical protein n=1 Tax=Escherichia coli TaxID=562 RepID=UPI00397D90FF
MQKKVFLCFFISLKAMGGMGGATINYVWTPADEVSLPYLEYISSRGERTKNITYPARKGTAGFHHKIYDCAISDWSGLWNKETYTYLAIPNRFPTEIGDIQIKTTFLGATYQWKEDGKDVSYWKTSGIEDKSLAEGSCAIYGDIGVMDFKFGTVLFEITVPTLPWAGELNISIPVYAANMEHWWNSSKGGNANWEYGYSQFKHYLDMPWYIPIKIKAYNICRLSANDININYGIITPEEALSGREISSKISVSCSYPSSLNVMFIDSSGNNSNIIPCGNGKCTLTVNNAHHINMSNITSVVLNLKSSFKTSSLEDGPFYANAILRIDVI